jgi:putative restriction endonuclease
MSSETILARFDAINVWKQGDQRAPHKPQLILYAFGRGSAGFQVIFLEAERVPTDLLQRFGPQRKIDHPEQPSWRLKNDGVWTVRTPSPLPLKTGDTVPRLGALRSPDVRASFTLDVQIVLADSKIFRLSCSTGRRPCENGEKHDSDPASVTAPIPKGTHRR